jgi:hypothetical protein
MGSSQEKRAARRLRHSAPLSVRTDAEKNAAQGESRDISSHGLFFFTQSRLEEASDIEVVLMMPPEISPMGQQWVCCHATVVRVEEDPEQKRFGIAAEVKRLQAIPEI